nr:PREDICTED: transient receptor potential cation channel subfamily V member 1-like [Lepisosteus oculatus]XP_015223030.1 PREDICTED: transient receptor potential cation channel subfamily V member 1-like [Lepisosteus oculatus]XP_015223031.1 PREDICTED: transient receptor potential cation channel subfamily V member 1-like [Lepisosteus oculatus]XP_015223032.1 PREDICTED: transient receptor potential cation channel subfamily V member 1-like [Lepisosteus oculatus]XP_015223033.1 PREDICTED: transient rec
MSRFCTPEEDKSESTEETILSLETDDTQSEDGRSQTSKGKKGLLSSAFGIIGSAENRVPMDTGYQEDITEPKPKVKFNLNFDKKVRGEAEGEGKRQTPAGKFDMKKLFEAVASGEVKQLDGLEEYLRQTMKRLTNSEFKDPSNGKTALLKGLLNLKEGHNDTIMVLLNIAEKTGNLEDFINAAYTDSYYKGQSALHIAIERRSMHFVKCLIQKGANVHARACGKFFQLNRGSGFYFGELPLSLAACTNQLEVVAFLMENPYQSVKVTESDSMGNTVLHALVVVADDTPESTRFVTKMYDEILMRAAKLHPKVKLEDVTNNQGLTPLKLAARTGKLGLFKHIVRREIKDSECRHLSRKFTEWAYGPVHSSLYDLASLDSYEPNSVLQIIVYGSEIPNRHELLQVEPLNKLLQEKWDRFASKMFFFNFFVYVIYLSIFTTVAYFRLEGKPPFPLEHSTKGYLRLTGQLIGVSGAIYFFYNGIVDFKRKRPKLESLLIDGYCEILFFLQAVFFLTSSVLYTCGRQEYVAFLVISLALGWVNLLYFSRGFQHLGIYSVMIQKMILGDILRFLFVYIVFLFGFSAAIVTLLEEQPAPPLSGNGTAPNGTGTGTGTGTEPNPTPGNPADDCKKQSYNNFYYTTLELFKFTIGMGDLEFTEQYRFKKVFYFLLISYIILTYILLLNMLIALMSETVERISRDSKSIWKLQRAITILDLEKSLPSCLRAKLRSGVPRELGRSPGDDCRRCFRVEEVNWNTWNLNLGIINEDPGNEPQEISTITPAEAGPRRARSWRNIVPILRDFNQARTQSPQEEEMRPISSSPH